MTPILIVAEVFCIFAVPIALVMGWPQRAALLTFGKFTKRPSIAKVLATSLMSPVVGQDWAVQCRWGSRMDAANDSLGVSAWCYTFSSETHLFEGSVEIDLAAWEKAVLRQALMRRGREVKNQMAKRVEAANDARLAEIATRVVNHYGSPLQRSETMQ